MKKEIGKEITIDELAGMMNTSFDDLRLKIKEVKEEMREGFEEVRTEMREGFAEVNSRMDNFEEYKDFPEGKRFHNHESRISRLEDSMRIVKTAIRK